MRKILNIYDVCLSYNYNTKYAQFHNFQKSFHKNYILITIFKISEYMLNKFIFKIPNHVDMLTYITSFFTYLFLGKRNYWIIKWKM